MSVVYVAGLRQGIDKPTYKKALAKLKKHVSDKDIFIIDGSPWGGYLPMEIAKKAIFVLPAPISILTTLKTGAQIVGYSPVKSCQDWLNREHSIFRNIVGKESLIDMYDFIKKNNPVIHIQQDQFYQYREIARLADKIIAFKSPCKNFIHFKDIKEAIIL